MKKKERKGPPLPRKPLNENTPEVADLIQKEIGLRSDALANIRKDPVLNYAYNKFSGDPDFQKLMISVRAEFLEKSKKSE